MTFISEALYISLKNEQQSLLKEITDLTRRSSDLTKKVKEEEEFLSSYDSTISKIQSSINNAEDQINAIEARLKDSEESLAKTEDSLKSAIETLKEEENKLREAIEEKAPEKVIDDLNAALSIATSKVKDLDKQKDELESQIDLLKVQEKDNSNLIANSKTQIAENTAKKDDLEKGALDDLKATLLENNKSLAEVNDSMLSFTNNNQETINLFEAQDERRNKLIRVSSNRKIFERPLPALENDVIANEDEVLKEVVENELDISNLSEDEEKLLAKAIEDARKVDFDPNFLLADQASDMARAANFSLLPVSKAIKEAAMLGLYSIVVQHLSDSNIYALEQAGYVVILTPNDLPEFEIRWDKINTKQGA